MQSSHCQAAEGPRPGLDALYVAHAESVWRVARLQGVPEAHVDDVVHDVFVIAHRSLARLDRTRSARAWLHGIARNVVLHHRRSHARAKRRLEVVRPPSSPPDPDEHLARAEAVRFLDRFLDALEPEQREVFVLFEVEELSAKEIAIAVGANINTIFSRLRSARRRFAAAVAAIEEPADG